jgi:Tol biopolymer transport system component
VRVLVAIGALAAFLSMPAAAAAPPGRIVFVRGLGEQSDLFSIRPDRSGLKRLTRETGFDASPVWSPDGRLLASFGVGGVVIRTAGGSVLRRIAIPVDGFLEELRWSPDGRWLSYLVEHCSYQDPRGYVVPPCADLWITHSDGGGTRRLLDRDVDLLDWGVSYAWSPGSRRLVYEALSSGATTLAVVDLQSGAARRIPGTAGAADPVWSPRREIAYARGRTVFTVEPNGGRPRRLVRGTSLTRPAWSPNGRHLVYLASERARVGNLWGVWTVRADGSHRLRIGAADLDRELAWSPDSRRLLWENESQRLIVARADRRATARFLTRGSDPDWR